MASQISLYRMMIVVSVLCVLSSVTSQLLLHNSRWAVERVLFAMFVAVFLFCYTYRQGTFQQRVWRTILVTSLAWSIGIASSYIAFGLSFGMPFGWKASFVHGFVVSCVGSSVAAVGVLCLEVIRQVPTMWRVASRRVRLVSGLGAILSIVAIEVVTGSDPTWAPVVRPSSMMEADSMDNLISRFNLIGELAISSDRRFVAQLKGARIDVFGSQVSNRIKTLEAGAESWFRTGTFSSDNAGFATVHFHRNGAVALREWDTRTWKSTETTALRLSETIAQGDEWFPVLADSKLLFVLFSRFGNTVTTIRIFTVDPFQGAVEPKLFGTFNIPPATKFDTAMFKLTIPPKWSVSEDGQCIVAPKQLCTNGTSSVFVQGKVAPFSLRESLLRFMSSEQCLLWGESTTGLAWESHTGFVDVAMPFWKNMRMVTCYRIALFDYEEGEIILKSNWWECNKPRVDAYQSKVISVYNDHFLVWDLARRNDYRQPRW